MRSRLLRVLCPYDRAVVYIRKNRIFFLNKKRNGAFTASFPVVFDGAGDESRTRRKQLGKLPPYR